ncbi:ABC transporter permease subunit [Bacillus aerolatus]|uniref:ABC transporter permease subunit n=1 Tax=Bacillus aerolatus TaxID=2653354 RepID=A0A6I1FUS1_9BACI|nr:ABC transporter permease [Bacillus aerolatus]KAB7708673.1 ABC transporter permease subunit [Bacillus aerolatus]
MVRLIQNEWIKIFKRPGTYVMIGLLVLMAGTFAGFTKYDESKQKEAKNWQQIVKAENAAYEKQIKEGYDLSKDRKEYLQGLIKVNEYRLEHNVPADTKTTMLSFVEDGSELLSFAGLFMIIIAAGIVASEYTWGTIKLLLIRPISRTKILFSKYAAVVLFGLFMISVLFLVSALIGAILFGASGEAVHLAYEGGKVIEQSMFLYLLKVYLLKSADVFMLATMAFMISAVFRSSSLAIGISLFLLFIGTNVTMLIAIKYEWAKYLLFANTNLLQFENGRVLVEGMTFGFSLAVLAGYFIVFQLLAFITFAKRDVAA